MRLAHLDIDIVLKKKKTFGGSKRSNVFRDVYYEHTEARAAFDSYEESRWVGSG